MSLDCIGGDALLREVLVEPSQRREQCDLLLIWDGQLLHLANLFRNSFLVFRIFRSLRLHFGKFAKLDLVAVVEFFEVLRYISRYLLGLQLWLLHLAIVSLRLVLAALGCLCHDPRKSIMQICKYLLIVPLIVRIIVPDLLQEHRRCDDARG